MEKKNGLLDDGKCDVDDEEDDYETAFLKYLDSEEKRSSVSQSSCLENKNLKTHVTGSSLPPLLDTQSSSSVPNYLSSSYLPHKKHNFDAGIVMSNSEGERSGRDDDIKKPIIGNEGEAKEAAQILEKKTREAVLNWPDDKRRARTAKYFKKKNIASVSHFSGLSEKGSGKRGYRDDTSEEEMSDDDPDYVPGDMVDLPATYSKKKKPKSSPVSCFPRVSQRRNGKGEYRYKTFGEDDISGEDVSDDDPDYAPGDKVNLAPTYSKKKKNKKTAEKKINSTEQESPPELAFETRDKIISMGATDLKLIIQKPLNESDWLNGERGLSIPINQTIPTYFLTDEEKGKLGTKQEN